MKCYDKTLNFSCSEKGEFISPILQNLPDWSDFMAPIRELPPIVMRRLLVFGLLFTLRICLHGQTIQDTSAILQKVIDLPQLQTYFHVDKFPDRVPIVIYSAKDLGSVRLQKFDKPVQFTSKKERLSSKQYIDLQTIEVKKTIANVVLFYPVEGIHVSASLTNVGENWTILKSEVTEK